MEKVRIMITLLRTDSSNVHFVELVELLDKDLQVRDGEDHAFFKQYNKIDTIKQVVVAFSGDSAIGCGAFKPYSEDTVEVKRMFVKPENRGAGVAGIILAELEKWALELDYKKTILETGKRQPEAIRLYQKNGYTLIPNYDQYIGVESSVCMTKHLF